MHQAPRRTAPRRARLLDDAPWSRDRRRGCRGRHGDHRLACGGGQEEAGAGSTRHSGTTDTSGPTTTAPQNASASTRCRRAADRRAGTPRPRAPEPSRRRIESPEARGLSSWPCSSSGRAHQLGNPVQLFVGQPGAVVREKRRHHLQAGPFEEGVHHVPQRRSARGMARHLRRVDVARPVYLVGDESLLLEDAQLRAHRGQVRAIRAAPPPRRWPWHGRRGTARP